MLTQLGTTYNWGKRAFACLSIHILLLKSSISVSFVISAPWVYARAFTCMHACKLPLNNCRRHGVGKCVSGVLPIFNNKLNIKAVFCVFGQGPRGDLCCVPDLKKMEWWKEGRRGKIPAGASVQRLLAVVGHLASAKSFRKEGGSVALKGNSKCKQPIETDRAEGLN